MHDMHERPVDEQLSAFVDGELPRGEARLLIARLARDAGLRAEWARHHLVGEALRGTLPPIARRDLATRVAAALADEPVVAAARWTRPLAGGAIAATVAFLAVFGLRSDLAPPGGEVVPPLAAANPLGVVGAPSRVEFESESAEIEARLNSYLLDHESATGGRVQGVAPYMRGVAPAAVKQETTAVAEPQAEVAAPVAEAAPREQAPARQAAERPRP